MMIADLVDLEDLTNYLKEIGVSGLDEVGSDISESVTAWLADADSDQKEGYQQLICQLADKVSEGHVLPEAVKVLETLKQANNC